MYRHDSKSDSSRSARRWRLAIGLAALGATSAGADTSDAFAGAIETLADTLATHFVDPAAGRRYAAMLRAGLAAGKYAGIGDVESMARRLTQDLQATAPDGHLRVEPAPEPGASPDSRPDGTRRAGRPPDGRSDEQAPRRPAPAPIDLPSVAETRWIADGVAYLRFNQFAGEPASLAALRAFVTDYASAKAIIIDTRTLVRGGGMAEMDVLFAHLFDRETVLVEMAVAARSDRGGGSPSAGGTLRDVAGPAGMHVRRHVAVPDPTGRRLAEAEVYYLTSRRTRSAGEHFALALQRTHRGTIVGERTAGANHFGGFEPIGAGLVAFVPVGRTYDPDTGKDWEGTGIVPDVEVPAGQALDEALARAK